ncbi:TonB-dependent siderophore receptor [Luteimonas aestuarii]|uniref:TonB-dependent siderophore receptor n=1 Tax=Luteimonas aestuarii TaxID=453837 RepID=A0A4R5TL85_9GAMM|nr:TonB-dependent siderophore receptor [Luteimonas aestuarii]TDK23095.1 TonB-dependent siderophore receptor [Luteimonas aestuarii]
MTIRSTPPRLGGHCRRILAGAISLVLIAGAAHAQQADPATSRSASDLDRVVVTAPDYVPSGSMTATKSGAPLIETPQSISVVTRDQIDLLGFTDVQQAIRYTAGIVGENYGPDLRFDFLTLRGFTPKQYIDGLQAPITTTIFNVGVDLYGFQEVDVLKGPAAVLYGNSPPGGIYNLTSRRAEQTFGGELGVRFGNEDYKQVHGTVTGSLADGLAARATLLYRDRGSQTDHVTGERTYFAPTFTWDIGERTSLTGLAYYQKDANTGETNGYLPAHGTRLGNPNGVIPRSRNLGEPDYNRYDRTQSAIGWDFRHAFNDRVSFQQNAKWYDYQEERLIVYSAGFQADMRTVNRNSYPWAEDVEGMAIDNRFSFGFGQGARHSLLVGYDYRELENFARYGFTAAPPLDAFNPVYGASPIVTPERSIVFNNQRVRQGGLYVQDQIKAGNVVATLSGRYDDVNLHNKQTGNTTRQDEFTWRAGLNYVFDSGWAPYVSYGTSFEPVLGVDSETGEEFKPSTSAQVEAGVKFDARALPAGVRLFATAALYRIQQDNLVSLQSGQTPMSGRQLGEVQVQGAELEVVARIHDRWSINGSYTYTDSEVVRDAAGFAAGAPLPTTPEHKLTGLVDYTLQEGSLAGLGFGLGGRYLSKSAGSLPGQWNPEVIDTKSTMIWDAIVHYDRDNWRFALNATNLFDKEYVGRCSAIANCIYGQGRQLMASVTWRL